MADRIRVRVYNVRFGDAILVTVPDRDGGATTPRNILIDVGNVLGTEGGVDTVFKPAVDDLLKELKGKPLDLYVMTHEHLDHVQGLQYCSANYPELSDLANKLKPAHVWMTASADPDYAQIDPDAKKKTLALYQNHQALQDHLKALEAQGPTAALAAAYQAILKNNNLAGTKDCIDYLRNLAPKERVHYVHRETSLDGKHPFQEAQLEIWAPEKKSSDYYDGYMPLGLSAQPVTLRGPDAPPPPAPPPGVDAGTFRDLLAAREAGIWDQLLAIDKAANNTSIVFSLTWRKRVLLFPGDAEIGSWRMMNEKQKLRKVDFLKVAHHGSHNGTPDADLLDKIMAGPSKSRKAAISTWEKTYNGIPDTPTNEKLKARATLTSTLDDPDKPYWDFFFTGKP